MIATNYDVIVIGGGPSGLMAAAAAGEQGAKVLLLEKGDKLGKKLAISGGGRCNVTNRLPIAEIIKHIPGNGRFMYSPFATFNNENIIAFFEKLGIKLKEEDRGRMFPVSDKAKDVVNALVNRVRDVGVHILTNTPVGDVLYEEDRVSGVKLAQGEIIYGQAVILAVGGKSVPHTGSTGDGYVWAERAGHTITELFPTEVPLISNEEIIKSKALQGLALRNVEVSVLNNKGKRIITHEGDMLFTHFGLSGPTILRCSQFVVKELKKDQVNAVTIEIDMHPSKSEENVFQELTQHIEEHPKKAIKNVWLQVVPERLLQYLFTLTEMDPDTPAQQVKKKQILHFAQLLKHFQIKVHGTRSIEEAFVTGGGVHLKEIDPKTMQSKLMEHLFFCGEILDIHGYTGGYNITVALSTGYVAGLNAGRVTKNT